MPDLAVFQATKTAAGTRGKLPLLRMSSLAMPKPTGHAQIREPARVLQADGRGQNGFPIVERCPASDAVRHELNTGRGPGDPLGEWRIRGCLGPGSSRRTSRSARALASSQSPTPASGVARQMGCYRGLEPRRRASRYRDLWRVVRTAPSNTIGRAPSPSRISSGGRRNQEMRQPIERPGYARCSCRPGAKNAVSQVEPAAARPGNSGELVGVALQVLTDGLSQDRG